MSARDLAENPRIKRKVEVGNLPEPCDAWKDAIVHASESRGQGLSRPPAGGANYQPFWGEQVVRILEIGHGQHVDGLAGLLDYVAATDGVAWIDVGTRIGDHVVGDLSAQVGREQFGGIAVRLIGRQVFATVGEGVGQWHALD